MKNFSKFILLISCVMIFASKISYSSDEDKKMQSELISDLQLKVFELEELISSVNGGVEENTYKNKLTIKKLDTYNKDLNLQISDINKRLEVIEKDILNIEEEISETIEVQAKEIDDLKSQNEEQYEELDILKEQMEEVELYIQRNPTNLYGTNADEHYDQAYKYIRKENYEKAQKALEAFIKLYPKHKLTSEVYYWLGEILYEKEDYEKAVVIFAEGFKKFPEAETAGINMLKLGLSMTELDKKLDACKAYEQILKNIEDAPKKIKKSAKIEMEKLHCDDLLHPKENDNKEEIKKDPIKREADKKENESKENDVNDFTKEEAVY